MRISAVVLDLDEVTDSNDRDGVAIVLERLIYPPPSLERDPIR